MRLFIFFLLYSFIGLAQDLSEIKLITDTYPGLMTVEKLAKKIEIDFSTDEDKVKATYCWLTKNIRYDLKEFYNPNRKTRTTFRYRTEEEKQQKLKAINNKIVRNTLTKRRAVCEGYARTLAEVCTILNIENSLVTGHVRNSSQVIGNSSLTPNHAWNAVKINNKWIYIDATWGAGSELNGRWIRKFNPYYYNIPKNKYFKTHFPEDSVWRLRVGRITKEKYYNQPIYSNDFLKSDIELKAPTSGILKKKKDNTVHITLDNLRNKEVFVGFLGNSNAYKPEIRKKGNSSLISFIPPVGAKQCFILIDREVALEFLIQ